MEYYKKLFNSFIYAFRGIYDTVKTERNMRIHITCLVYMFSILSLTDWFKLEKVDWAILVIASGTVLAGEVINTAIENTVNLVSKEYNEYAKRAKDAAAGAVLISAVFAVITGFIIMFQPPAFISMFSYFKSNPLHFAVFALSLLPATLFIFLPKRKKK